MPAKSTPTKSKKSRTAAAKKKGAATKSRRIGKARKVPCEGVFVLASLASRKRLATTAPVLTPFLVQSGVTSVLPGTRASQCNPPVAFKAAMRFLKERDLLTPEQLHPPKEGKTKEHQLPKSYEYWRTIARGMLELADEEAASGSSDPHADLVGMTDRERKKEAKAAALRLVECLWLEDEDDEEEDEE
uniref:Uncharacterized protein n=1 Tax=Bionectria ochroleuca TaxID=29856 RepID=A0A8H7K1T8_BIOOC